MRVSSKFIMLFLLLIPLLPLSAQETADTETPTPTATAFPSATVSLQPIDPLTTATPTNVPFLTMGDIGIGEEVSGTFPENVYEIGYLLQGEAGDNITITLTGASVYGGCFRLESDEVYVSSSSLNTYDTAVINFFTLPTTGPYRIVLNQCGGISDYTLRVESVTLEPIAYEQVIDGTLTPTHAAANYRLTGRKDEMITINLVSEQFDSLLQLSTLSASGTTIITTDDNSGGNLNAFIGPYKLPISGDYLITVDSSLSGVGNYRLVVNRLEPQAIQYGDELTVNLTEQVPMQIFAFEATEGELIDIEIDSEDRLDTILTLSDPNGNPALSDDDSGQHFDPEIIRQLIYLPGIHWILVRSYAIGESGQVQLTLSRHSSLSLNDVSQLVTLTSKINLATLSFTGLEGQRVRLIVRRMKAPQPLAVGFSSPSIHVAQNSQTLADASLQGGDTFAFEFVVPSDGLVSVQLREAGSVGGVYEVSLERE